MSKAASSLENLWKLQSATKLLLFYLSARKIFSQTFLNGILKGKGERNEKQTSLKSESPHEIMAGFRNLLQKF